jgi:transposase
MRIEWSLKLTDSQWKINEECLNQVAFPKVRGKPRVSFRKVFNAILYVLTTGCRWQDLPMAEEFATKSTAHLWLKKLRKWEVFDLILLKLLKQADFRKKINWDQLSIDGTFSPRIRRWRASGTRI